MADTTPPRTGGVMQNMLTPLPDPDARQSWSVLQLLPTDWQKPFEHTCPLKLPSCGTAPDDVLQSWSLVQGTTHAPATHFALALLPPLMTRVLQTSSVAHPARVQTLCIVSQP